MKYVAVMPYRVQDWADACLATCRLDPLLLVDNTVHNLGIMRSHNLGVDLMRQQDADWLIILSAAVRFGAPGGLDYIAQLEDTPWSVVPAQGVFGWHLIAFRRDLVEETGRWDENFSPYGYDDVDYSIRTYRAQPAHTEGGVPVDLTDAGMGHSLRYGGVRPDNSRLLAYLKAKWGHHHGHEFAEYHLRPFDDDANAVGYWPAINGGEWDKPAPPTDQARIR